MPRAIGLHAVREFDRRAPLSIGKTRRPDADIGIPLTRATEPRGDQPAARRFHDGRRMAARKRRGLVDELGFQKARLRFRHERAGQQTEQGDYEKALCFHESEIQARIFASRGLMSSTSSTATAAATAQMLKMTDGAAPASRIAPTFFTARPPAVMLTMFISP